MFDFILVALLVLNVVLLALNPSYWWNAIAVGFVAAALLISCFNR